MMVNRILANFLICLESDDRQNVFNDSVPDGYQSTILAVADAPEWLSISHWQQAFQCDNAQVVDLRIDELMKQKDLLYKQICVECNCLEQLEDELSRCEIELEILTSKRKLIQDVHYLRSRNPELAETIWSIIQATT